jgi:hypothetical protein
MIPSEQSPLSTFGDHEKTIIMFFPINYETNWDRTHLFKLNYTYSPHTKLSFKPLTEGHNKLHFVTTRNLETKKKEN